MIQIKKVRACRLDMNFNFEIGAVWSNGNTHQAHATTGEQPVRVPKPGATRRSCETESRLDPASVPAPALLATALLRARETSDALAAFTLGR
jgi:hypothetical protein